MNFIYETGDLLASDEFVIAHGCNCQGVMGAGIAKQIRREFPQVYREYVATAPQVLGSAQCVMLDNKVVFNLMTQRYPGPDARLGAITMAFANMAEIMMHHEYYRVGIPRIGCGIGGLAWTNVEHAIARGVNLSSNADLTVVVYDLT